MNTYTLPTMLDFAPTFKAVLRFVVESGYSDLDAGTPEDIRFVFDNDKGDFDVMLSNAIGEACTVLGVGEAAGAETGDWLGDLYDLAEEMGYSWDDEDE